MDIKVILSKVINIAVAPIALKDLYPEETVFPAFIDVRNGEVTNVGKWIKRPGYSEKFNIAGNRSIRAMIKFNNFVYIILSSGLVYKTSDFNTSVLITDTYNDNNILSVSTRPDWTFYNDYIVVCAGGIPLKIERDRLKVLSNDLSSRIKYIEAISSYIIVAGYDDTQFRWSVPNNPSNFVDGGFANVSKRGGNIKNIKVVRERIYIFKEEDIECWLYVGGASPFIRQDGLWMEPGTGASDSVIVINNDLYWFGNDNSFYRYNGNIIIDISKKYSNYLNKLVKTDDMYGIHFAKDKLVKWYVPSSDVCIVYDYDKDLMWEENYYLHGQWMRMPVASYVEFNNKQYIGDYYETGKISEWSKDYFVDGTTETPVRMYYSLTIIPAPTHNRVRVNRLRFRLKQGTNSTYLAGSYVNKYLRVKIRIDKGDWGLAKNVEIRKVGDRSPYAELFNIGVGREFDIEIVDTNNLDILITDINVTYREFTN